MKLNGLATLALTSLTLLIGNLPALAAAPTLILTLDGKPVTSVPVDRLGQVMVTLKTNGPSFRQMYTGQWQGIDQSMNVMGLSYPRSGAVPELEDSHRWNGYSLEKTTNDSTWGSKTSLSRPMNKIASAQGLELYSADTDDNVIFTGRFRRKVYTGKKVWVDNGWVNETRWETLGPTFGKASLKLEPPTFAGSLNAQTIFAPALQQFNAPPANKYDTNKAMKFSRTLLYPQSYGGREVNFNGSAVKTVESAAGTPKYSWNYDGNTGKQLVYARFPAIIKVHAVINTQFDSMPVPLKTEADFNCPMDAVITHPIGGGSWEPNDIELNNASRLLCKTADGKTPDEIVQSINPTQNVTGTSPEDILKGLGF